MAEIKVVKVKEGNGTRTYWQYDGKNYGSEKQAQEAKRKAEEFKFGSSPQQANVFGQHATGQSLHGTFTAGSVQDPSFTLQVEDAVNSAQSGVSPNGAKGGNNRAAGGGSVHADTGPLPASGGGGGGGGFGSSARTDAEIEAEIREKFPGLAGFLAIPEVKEKLYASIREGWPPEKLNAQIATTEWWKTTPPKTRAWTALEAIDPAAARAQVNAEAFKFQQLARQYALPMADISAKKWASDFLAGRVDEEDVKGFLIEHAVSLFPGLRAAFEANPAMTVEQYAAPYREIAARELEISPDEVDWMDGKWNRALNTVDKDGNRVSMSLSEWQSTLRSDPTYGWDRTAGARQQASQFATQLAQKFGRM